MRFVTVIIIAFLSVAKAQSPSPKQLSINAPFVASESEIVDTMLELAGVTSSDTVFDLGCGDGRIVISAAKKYGARGVGIDINPDRIEEARDNARSAGVADRVRFEVNDLFDADIHDATVIALYLLPDVNIRLRPRLLRELKPGTRVVSHSFHMGDWKPDQEKVVGEDHVYLWTIPERRGDIDKGAAAIGAAPWRNGTSSFSSSIFLPRLCQEPPCLLSRRSR